MQIPERWRPAAWLTTVVLAIALISEVFNQSHHITLAVLVLAVVLLTVDWLVGARKSD